jgi:hypothetical protein
MFTRSLIGSWWRARPAFQPEAAQGRSGQVQAQSEEIKARCAKIFAAPRSSGWDAGILHGWK